MPVSSTPKRRRAADFQPESLAAAGWLESKVSEREFKNFQDLMREAIDGLLADFASHESRINEKMKEMEERLDAVEYAEDLSASSEIFGNQDDAEEEEAREEAEAEAEEAREEAEEEEEAREEAEAEAEEAREEAEAEAEAEEEDEAIRREYNAPPSEPADDNEEERMDELSSSSSGSSSSSSSASTSDSGDSDSDNHANPYDREKFQSYNEPQPGPYYHPWEQKRISFPACKASAVIGAR